MLTYMLTESNPGSLTEGILLVVGGRYDYLLHQMWDREYVGYTPRTNPPCAVGASLALETIIQHSPIEFKSISYRNESGILFLVCSRGGGGLLCMELVAELWEKNIKAQLVPTPDPSLREQHEYASEHDTKGLVIITDSGAQTGFVKVRHLDLKREKEVERENLVSFLLEEISTQLRKPFLWS
ncbi:eIF-2-alpha kinase GCN2-like [Melia azedarach]|uniref:EIF-2-alpha kinase GCN2-like n=1 Tax=Melia azedarach TaxID=155640 RepID=A0ACC1YIZ4_MELAZ|nr:eIF-2-alpha kinase GCN2-like [Melia azedarach]